MSVFGGGLGWFGWGLGWFGVFQWTRKICTNIVHTDQMQIGALIRLYKGLPNLSAPFAPQSCPAWKSTLSHHVFFCSRIGTQLTSKCPLPTGVVHTRPMRMLHNTVEQIYATVIDIRHMTTFILFVWFDSLRPINILSIMYGRFFLGWTSTKLGLMCLAQGHKAVTPVRLEPADLRSRVKHSTAEPLRSLQLLF